MSESQPTNSSGPWIRLSSRQRWTGCAWFVGIVGAALILALLQKTGFDFGRILGSCGLKQRTGLTCPTCGMTTATLAFVRGEWALAWYLQPAAGLFCALFVLIALGGLATALTGRMPVKVQQFYAELKWRYILIFVAIVISAGWAVTFVRAWRSLR